MPNRSPSERDGGLTPAEVEARRAAGLTNAFRPRPSRTAGQILRANVLTPFNMLVTACFLLLLVLGRWQDALFGFAAIGNAVIGSVQELRAKKALDRLSVMTVVTASVRREGRERRVAVSEIVLDDLVILRPGDHVAVDCRVRSAVGLQVDESLLTGEAEPVDRMPGDELLSGSFVVAGRADAIVVRVGAATYANRYADAAQRFSLVSSELRSAVDRLLRGVGWAIGPIGIVVLNAQMVAAGGWATAWRSGAWADAVVGAVAALIAMVPLGLVLMTSIAFAVGAARLAGRNVLVRELAAVEGLARVDTICIDKTGTLTDGSLRFEAAHILADAPGWREALAWFGADDDANATARCLASAFVAADPRGAVSHVPFESHRRWSAAMLAEDEGTWVLGAADIVAGRAAADPSTPLGGRIAAATGAGLRTLLLAHSPHPCDDAGPSPRLPPELRGVAIVTFAEHVRPDAPRTLEFFRAEGVDIRVLSGDDPETVAAIARKAGMADAADGTDARDLPDDDDALDRLIAGQRVLGRVAPEQKRRIIHALQRQGRVVAMVGDGVNDVLALKQADLGIAMNTAAPVTRAVARVVLLDGQFDRLPHVLDEGRRVIANMERVSLLFVTKTAYAMTLALLSGMFFTEFPLLPRQLSLTDGLTIGIPAFFLALLPNAARYRPGVLRRCLRFAVPAGIVIALALWAFSRAASPQGIDAVRAGTTVVLVGCGVVVLLAASWPLTVVKTLIIGAMCALFVLVVSVAPLRQFFALDAVVLLDPVALVLSTVLAGVGIVLVALFARRRNRGIVGSPTGRRTLVPGARDRAA